MKRQNGITLIALVITIIVLLILAGVSISMVLGSNGVLGKAQGSVNATKKATAQEQVTLAWGSCTTDYLAYGRGQEKSTYFTVTKLNENLSEGEITAVSVGTTAEGDSEVAYKVDDTYYKLKVSASGLVSVVGEPTATAPTLSETVTPSVGGSVTIGDTTITKDNLGEHLGKAVNYVPANPSTDYGTGTTYRLFYIDFDNDFGDGEGTVYLKADEDGKNVSLSSYTSYASTDSLAVMGKLNPDWKSKKGTATLTSEKCVSWILDPNMWANWKDTTTASVKDNINYVVGAPSLEMYVKSYNTYLSAHTGVYKNASTTDLAENLACEYTVDSTYTANGYRIGFESVESASWANAGYYQAQNSIFSSTEANAMYNPGSSKYYWLASPSAHISNNVMYVYGARSRVRNGGYHNNYAFCPLVSLKSNVTLTWK